LRYHPVILQVRFAVIAWVVDSHSTKKTALQAVRIPILVQAFSTKMWRTELETSLGAVIESLVSMDDWSLELSCEFNYFTSTVGQKNHRKSAIVSN
jgi:hypothetical protein